MLGKVYTGRKDIYVSGKEITEILNNALNEHLTNRAEIDYLYNYYKGKQPILEKVKTVRPEINNSVVINHAYEFVNFYVGYVFGEEIQYVSAGDCNSEKHGQNDNEISRLNQMMREEDKSTDDRALAQWLLIGGVAYRMCLPKIEDGDAPFEFETLDPRNTFIIRSREFKNRPLYGVTYTIDENLGMNGIIYSPTTIYRFQGEAGGITAAITSQSPNVLGMIPIVEYKLNPEKMGVFEPVISALDCLNNITSNRMDAIEQFVQSLLVLKNCDIDEETITKLMQLGALMLPTAESDAQMLTAELDQLQTQSFVDDLYQTILQIVGVPDRQASSGGNTGTALEIGQGWVVAESRAKSIEKLWIKSEYQFLKIVKNIVDTATTDLDICLSDIFVKFTRNKTSNLLTKTQGLMNQLSAGIHPRIAIETIGLYSDPENVYVESKEYLRNMGYKEYDANEVIENKVPLNANTEEQETQIIKDTTT